MYDVIISFDERFQRSHTTNNISPIIQLVCGLVQLQLSMCIVLLEWLLAILKLPTVNSVTAESQSPHGTVCAQGLHQQAQSC